MTPLRQRFIEDMLLRGLAPTTQRSYIHYVAHCTFSSACGPTGHPLPPVFVPAKLKRTFKSTSCR